MGMTREELRDYVDEQRTLNNIPYHVYSALIDGIDTLEQEPTTKNDLGVEDCISRADAIKAIQRYGVGCFDSDDFSPEQCERFVIGKLKELPIVEPKAKTGHWIETAEEYYKVVNEKGGGVNENTPYFTDDIACSECLTKFSVIDNETERFECCPNCGAKMEVNDADSN